MKLVLMVKGWSPAARAAAAAKRKAMPNKTPDEKKEAAGQGKLFGRRSMDPEKRKRQIQHIKDSYARKGSSARANGDRPIREIERHNDWDHYSVKLHDGGKAVNLKHYSEAKAENLIDDTYKKVKGGWKHHSSDGSGSTANTHGETISHKEMRRRVALHRVEGERDLRRGTQGERGQGGWTNGPTKGSRGKVYRRGRLAAAKS